MDDHYRTTDSPKRDVIVDESSNKYSESEKDVLLDASHESWDPSACQYEGDKYVYRDPVTHTKYVWDEEANTWILDKDESSDEKDNVEHMKTISEPVKNSEPVANVQSVNSLPENYQFDGESYVYTNKETNVTYKWNIAKHQWEVKRFAPKRRQTRNEDEEFDTDSEEEEEEEKPKAEKKAHFATQFPKLQDSDYNAETGSHTFRDPKDGSLYEWDAEKNAWFPKIDQEFLALYQLNYGFTPSGEVAPPVVLSQISEKKPEIVKTEKKPPVIRDPEWFELDEAHNTKVYVSGLPHDITEEEFVDTMQKCGLVMRDPDSGKMKVKLYKDHNGQLKGDALCSYIKIESVDLALELLDGYDLRNHKMKVERARFEMKGSYNPSLKPRKRRKKDKEKLKRKQEKLFAWVPDKLRGERMRNEKVVVVKNLFDPKDFDKEVSLILEYKQDLREECSKCGDLKKVVIHDRNPEGVAQIHFADAEEADVCIKLLNGRWFGKRKITAETWDGRTKYRVEETEEEKAKRLGTWNQFLEQTEADNDEKEKCEELTRKDEQSISYKNILDENGSSVIDNKSSNCKESLVENSSSPLKNKNSSSEESSDEESSSAMYGTNSSSKESSYKDSSLVLNDKNKNNNSNS